MSEDFQPITAAGSGKSEAEVAFDLVNKLKGQGVWGERNLTAILDMYAECLDATRGMRKYQGQNRFEAPVTTPAMTPAATSGSAPSATAAPATAPAAAATPAPQVEAPKSTLAEQQQLAQLQAQQQQAQLQAQQQAAQQAAQPVHAQQQMLQQQFQQG